MAALILIVGLLGLGVLWWAEGPTLDPPEHDDNPGLPPDDRRD